MTNQNKDRNITEEQVNLQDLEQFLCYSISNKVFAFELLTVHEILKPVFITRLANVQEYILGVINLRGEIIPIVDIRKRFGLPYSDLTSSSRIIVVVSSTYDKKFGVLVDEVRHVVKIEKKNISLTIDDMLSDNMNNMVKSVSRVEGDLILNLDVNDIIEFKSGEK